MKVILFCLLALSLCPTAYAQKRPAGPPPLPVINTASRISKPNLARLAKIEDTLQMLLNQIMYDTTVRITETSTDYTGAIIVNMSQSRKDTSDYFKAAKKEDAAGLKRRFDRRKQACYQFIPKLMAALKVDNSFYYPFDSLAEVSRIYPPDSSFRILTWQMHYPKGRFRYYGIIQMKSAKMKVYPLKDLRDTLPFHTQQVLGADNWYGQLYYKIVEKTVNKKTYYTLFGFEAADFISRRKLIDILTFDEAGKPKFGAPLFQFKYDSTHVKMIDTMSRFFLEYKWNASPTLNYNYDKDMIVFDHLSPPNPHAAGAYFTYVQDGTYEGFRWQGNHWQWQEQAFHFSIDENDNPPIPAPLFGIPKKQPTLPTEIER